MITIEKYGSADHPDWKKVLKHTAFRPVQYEAFWIAYQEHYQRSRADELLPAYYVFYSEEAPVRRPVAVWPLSVQRAESGYECGFLNDDIFPPLIVKDLVPKIVRQVYDRCWDIIKGIKDNIGITAVFTVASLVRGYAWRRIFNDGILGDYKRDMRHLRGLTKQGSEEE